MAFFPDFHRLPSALRAAIAAVVLVVCTVLFAQQVLVLAHEWRNGKGSPPFDPAPVLRVVKGATLVLLGVALVVGGLVFHWRVGHGRDDWDWPLILLHADADDGQLWTTTDACLSECATSCGHGP